MADLHDSGPQRDAAMVAQIIAAMEPLIRSAVADAFATAMDRIQRAREDSTEHRHRRKIECMEHRSCGDQRALKQQQLISDSTSAAGRALEVATDARTRLTLQAADIKTLQAVEQRRLDAPRQVKTWVAIIGGFVVLAGLAFTIASKVQLAIQSPVGTPTHTAP